MNFKFEKATYSSFQRELQTSVPSVKLHAQPIWKIRTRYCLNKTNPGTPFHLNVFVLLSAYCSIIITDLSKNVTGYSRYQKDWLQCDVRKNQLNSLGCFLLLLAQVWWFTNHRIIKSVAIFLSRSVIKPHGRMIFSAIVPWLSLDFDLVLQSGHTGSCPLHIVLLNHEPHSVHWEETHLNPDLDNFDV